MRRNERNITYTSPVLCTTCLNALMLVETNCTVRVAPLLKYGWRRIFFFLFFLYMAFLLLFPSFVSVQRIQWRTKPSCRAKCGHGNICTIYTAAITAGHWEGDNIFGVRIRTGMRMRMSDSIYAGSPSESLCGIELLGFRSCTSFILQNAFH
jgi:hypothetical protein